MRHGKRTGYELKERNVYHSMTQQLNRNAFVYFRNVISVLSSLHRVDAGDVADVPPNVGNTVHSHKLLQSRRVFTPVINQHAVE
jgi:hypothetical protein